MSNLIIRQARVTDANVISRLGLRSKASWGYDDAAMAVFAGELKIYPEALAGKDCHVAERRSGEELEIVGYYTLVPCEEPDKIELDHFFVHADDLRQGIGQIMMEHAMARCVERGFKRMTLISDPHAAGFYERFGATKTGDHQSSIPGRSIPIYELKLV